MFYERKFEGVRCLLDGRLKRSFLKVFIVGLTMKMERSLIHKDLDQTSIVVQVSSTDLALC